MELLEEFISGNLKEHPELGEYNVVILNFIKEYQKKRPDMCIEGCKSLIEGVSKLVYFNLDSENQNSTAWRNFNLGKKFENCVSRLGLNGYENEFLNENYSIVLKLGQIRNERGDISHGQAYPKDSYSDVDFAIFIKSWTEGLCYFLLLKYLARKQEKKDSDSVNLYSDQQFKDFNEYLDEIHSELTDISYSKALKEQDIYQYELLMDSYFGSKENAA